MTDHERSAPLSLAWAVAAATLVLLATLPPQPEGQGSPAQFFTAILPGTRGEWFDVAQNIALYLPLGLALALRNVSCLGVATVAVLLSLVTELVQIVIPGRDPSFRDVLSNASGALLGCYLLSTRVGNATKRLARQCENWIGEAGRLQPGQTSRLLLGWSAVVALLMTLTGFLLQPAPPPYDYAVSGPYFDRAPGPLRIGNNGMPGGGFHGEIDEVRIFDRARTGEQIRQDMARSAAPAQAEDAGLVAAFGFDRQSDTVARDDSGHGHDGLLHGTTWTAQGRLGGALSFDGGSSEVLIPPEAQLDLSDGMTLEAWVHPATTTSHEPAIIAKQGSHYYLDQASAFGPFAAAGGGHFGAVPRYTRLTSAIAPGEWTHLATTYDGQVIRLYKNGSLAATKVHWSPHRYRRLRLNGAELPYGDLADTNAVRRALLHQPAFDMLVECGPPFERAAPVLLIVGLQDRQVLAWEAAGRDLLLRPWTRARKVGLASPPTRVLGALSGCEPGRLMNLSANGWLQNPKVARDGRDVESASPGVASTWSFIIHAELLPSWLQNVATLTWLGMLCVPLGLWCRPNALSAAALGLPFAASVAAASIFALRYLNVAELGAMVVGAVAGVLWQRMSRDRHPSDD